MKEQIKALMDRLDKRRESIANYTKPNWKTSGIFPLTPDSNIKSTVAIHVENDRTLLNHLYVDLCMRNEQWKKVINGLKFSWGGYSFSDWEEDLITRKEHLDYLEEKASIQKLEKDLRKLTELASPELIAEIELERLTNEI